jgi:transcriptional regulator with XRE-family HTH domain
MTATVDVAGGDDVRRQELAHFLRSRRERITPEQVGLTPGGRRRTPGLRREEVAQLAGVGVTWYTWLEQGRDIKVSDNVLTAVATTLRLDPHERAHMFQLAGSPQPPLAKECNGLSPRMLMILRQLEPLPASVANSRMDILGYNRTFERLFDLDSIPFEERNSLIQMCTNPEWRARLTDWRDSMPRMIAQFRTSMAEHLNDSSWKSLVRRLQAESAEFAVMWDRHDVKAIENLTKRFQHPDVGFMAFDYTNLWFGPRSEARLTTYTPCDADTLAKIRILAAEAKDVDLARDQLVGG